MRGDGNGAPPRRDRWHDPHPGRRWTGRRRPRRRVTAARASGAGRPPEPRRQFQVVATVWLILAAAYGVAFAFPIFFVALLDEFRWSRALTAGAMSMSTLLQGLLAPVTGIVVDRMGPRGVI